MILALISGTFTTRVTQYCCIRADWTAIFFSALVENQAAVERKFEIMGEAIRQCQQHSPVEVTQLGDGQGVVDFRNYLAHRYHAVKSDLVWDIVENDLPSLVARVKVLLPPRKPAGS